MEKIPELAPEQAEAVAWLRTAEGEAWDHARLFRSFLARQPYRDGVFAHLIPDSEGWKAQSRMRLSGSAGDPP